MSSVYTVPSRYTPHQLVYTYRHTQEHPLAIYRTPGGTEFTAAGWRAWFRDRLDEKILASDPRAPKASWRKVDEDYQRALRIAARQVNTPRLVVRWVPKDLRARLAHRLHVED